MYSQDQQIQIAIAYAQATATKETTPQEFLHKINSIIEECNPPEPPSIASFKEQQTDPAEMFI